MASLSPSWSPLREIAETQARGMYERVTGGTWARASDREQDHWIRARAVPLSDLGIFASRDVWRGVMARKLGLDAGAGVLYTAEQEPHGRWTWVLRDGFGRVYVVLSDSDIPPSRYDEALVAGLQVAYTP